jgi:hypothetical protein
VISRRRNRPRALLAAAALFLAPLVLSVPARGQEQAATIGRICDLIALHADANALPRAFFARLIFKESRFDPNAVSPKGAEGIAQFMPGTAAMRGLDDAFDIAKAIPASAEYLGELTQRFGNLGLAAAAYNAGEGRISRWLSSGGFLPLETENYVLDILGHPADSFMERGFSFETPPLHPEKMFGPACRAMPAARSAMVAMASVPVLPWGIQVAGNFNRAAAIRQWQNLKARHQTLLAGVEPVVSRARSGRGRAGVHTVRIGAETRGEADRICNALRSAGGACIVTRNR